jgi:hypothetical protein
VHWTPLQHGVLALQPWPYRAQTPASAGGGVDGGPQVPVPPATTLQTRPVQQSPVAVQVAPLWTQTMPPSFAVVVRQRSVPVESGTQGDSPQHSAAVLQVWPAGRQHLESVPLKMPVLPLGQLPEPRQRGRPSVS